MQQYKAVALVKASGAGLLKSVWMSFIFSEEKAKGRLVKILISDTCGSWINSSTRADPTSPVAPSITTDFCIFKFTYNVDKKIL
jgi:hypothetical protein